MTMIVLPLREGSKGLSNHTPGPWKVSPTYWAKYDANDENEPRSVHSWNVQSESRENQALYVDNIYSEANARLIAAAPALYEALALAKKEIRALHDRLFPEGWIIYETYSPEMKQINAALELAEKGEQR